MTAAAMPGVNRSSTEVSSRKRRTSAGRPASTYVAPGTLDSLTRRHLRESFRAIAHVQERLESEWQRRIGG